jgi:hypothetical protein
MAQVARIVSRQIAESWLEALHQKAIGQLKLVTAFVLFSHNGDLCGRMRVLGQPCRYWDEA